jgi:hypothetical protein
MKLIGAILILGLLGCAGNPTYGDLFENESIGDDTAGSARVVVFKKGLNTSSYTEGDHVVISVNGEKRGDLVEGSFIVFDLPPGKHKLTASVPVLERPVDALSIVDKKLTDKHIERDFSPDTLRFFQYKFVAGPIYTYEMRPYGSPPGARGYPVQAQSIRGVFFLEVDRATAAEELDCWANDISCIKELTSY